MHNSLDVGCLLLEISYTNYTICLIRLTRLQTCESTEKNLIYPTLILQSSLLTCSTLKNLVQLHTTLYLTALFKKYQTKLSSSTLFIISENLCST